MAYYFDTSALVKLVVREAESGPLRDWMAQEDLIAVTCDLTRSELLRAVPRADPDKVVKAREVLDSVILTRVSTAIFEEAGRLDPVVLRTLDAVHLAAALDLGDDLVGLVTYDTRLADAAIALGISVVAPA